MPALVYDNSFRRRRFNIIESMILHVLGANRTCRILDVGGMFDYWLPFKEHLDGLPIEVVIVNLGEVGQELNDRRFSALQADACALPFENGSFDLVHSNSVLEHVGAWRQMKGMADEIRRVGGSYYVQTPYFWFPFDPHSRMIGYQFIPRRVRAQIHMKGRLGFYPRAADYSDAMSLAHDAVMVDKMQMRALFPDAKLTDERVFGMTKSLIATRQYPGVRAS